MGSKIASILAESDKVRESVRGPLAKALTTLAVEATEAWAKRVYGSTPAPAKETADEKKAREIGEFIGRSDFGCQRASVASLMSLVTGLKIESRAAEDRKGVSFDLGVMVVPKGNYNNHNYPARKPAFMCRDAYGTPDVGMMVSGLLGNHIDSVAEQIRPATGEEIEKFFAEIPVDGLLVAAKHIAQHSPKDS